MRKITRRLTAAVLSAYLALSPFGAFAEASGGIGAQMTLPMQDGTQLLLPVQTMLTSAGETVYWLDMSAMDEAQLEALSMGVLTITDESGITTGQFFLDGAEATTEGDGLVVLHDALDPMRSVPLMLAPVPMPLEPEDAEAVLYDYGYEPFAEPEIVEPEIMEPEIMEPEIVEPEIVEPEIVEPEIVEPEIIEPEIVEPEIVEPEIVEPEIVEPEITEPENTLPTVVEQPNFVMPMQDMTNVRMEPTETAENVAAQVNANDVLAVVSYDVDEIGRIWWEVKDVRSGAYGYILSDMVTPVGEDAYYDLLAQMEQENQPEVQPEPEEPEQGGDFVEEIQPEQGGDFVEEIQPEQGGDFVEEIQPEQGGDFVEEPQPEQGGDFVEEPQTEQQPAVRYAVTSNKNNPTNNLRASAEGKGEVVGVYDNGELVILGEPSEDGKWYPVTVVRDGVQGYMRDYLLTEISEADAQVRMAEILKDKTEAGDIPETLPEVDEPETIPEVEEPETIPEIDEPETIPEVEEPETIPEIDEPETIPEVDEPETIPEVDEPETIPEVEEPETIPEVDEPETIPEVEEPETIPEIDEPETIPEVEENPDAQAFPLYAMTLPQDNAMIVLRPEAGGELPMDGNVPMIRQPTPLEVIEEQIGVDGQTWYRVRNMNTDESGFIESYKVELVTKEQAEAAVGQVEETLPPVPTDPDTNRPGQESGGEAETPEQPETPEQQPEQQPEQPDTPQELTEGSIYHYGRNTGRQVALRREPKASGNNRIYNMEQGTILWVMTREGEWCHVRTDRDEGYVKAEFVELMGVNEEAAYRASIDDPEMPPEETTAPETPETQPTESAAPEQVERYAVVTWSGVPVYATADDKAHTQGQLYQNDVVYVTNRLMNDAGRMWMAVIVGDQMGYLPAESLRLMTDEEQEDYLAQQTPAPEQTEPVEQTTPNPEQTEPVEQATPNPEQTEPVEQITPNPEQTEPVEQTTPNPEQTEPVEQITPNPEATATPAPQAHERYAFIAVGNAQMYANANAGANLLNVLSQNTVVYALHSEMNAAGEMWMLVKVNDQWGYVSADSVQLMTDQEQADYLAQLEASKPVPPLEATATPEPQRIER